MNCKTCTTETKQIATKTLRGASGVIKCHRLECGHAWHVITPSVGAAGSDGTPPTPCSCGEIVVVNALLAAGRQLALAKEALTDEDFRAWSKQVLEALDGIPAESGAPSLVRSATTATKSAVSSTVKKVGDLNALLVRAVNAVS
jgi:hypothetical protein